MEEGSRECARLTRRALIRRARRARLAHRAHSAAPAQPVSEPRESDLWSRKIRTCGQKTELRTEDGSRLCRSSGVVHRSSLTLFVLEYERHIRRQDTGRYSNAYLIKAKGP